MTASPTQRDPEHPRAPIRLADRLLAEAMRAAEQDGAALRDEAAAEEAARDRGGDLERRIVHRAAGASIAKPLVAALRHVRQATGWIVLIGIVLALIAGAGAVRAAIGAPRTEPINFFWLLASLLGVQTLLLLVWVVLMIAWPRSAGVSPLGGAALALGRWLAARMYRKRGAHQLAAIQAAGSVHARGPLGRWTLSAISHGLWLSFNVGLLTLLLLLLSAKEYTFNWETTILSGDAYVCITRLIGALPEAAGFLTPTAEQIVQSEWGATPGELERARVAWSGLLIGSIVLYGFAPRLLLLGLSLDARRRAARRFRLDTTAPGYQRLRMRLMPDAERRGIVGGAPGEGSTAPGSVAGPQQATELPAATGPPAIVGLEIERPAGAWPPALHGVRWTDLGFVDSRDDRRRVLDELGGLAEAPRMTIVVCALTTTPDRGIAAFLGQIIQACRADVALLLTAGQALRERDDAEQLARRVEDWRALAGSVGVPPERILELDLDHLTEASQHKLADLIGVTSSEEAPARRIEPAFDLIVAAAKDWDDSPNMKEQAELHRRIAEVYRPQAQAWRSLLHLPGELKKSELAMHARRSASRVVDLLPDRLKRSPKWLAAGALSGALGCITAAMFISPVAIGALPLWSAIGAAVAAVAQPGGKSSKEAPRGEEDRIARTDALRSAALFALLLELQGREEAAISRILDRTLADEEADEADLAGADACAGWLDEVRHRLDLALAAEGRA